MLVRCFHFFIGEPEWHQRYEWFYFSLLTDFARYRSRRKVFVFLLWHGYSLVGSVSSAETWSGALTDQRNTISQFYLAGEVLGIWATESDRLWGCFLVICRVPVSIISWPLSFLRGDVETHMPWQNLLMQQSCSHWGACGLEQRPTFCILWVPLAHTLTVVGLVIFGLAPNVFILLSKYLDSTHYVPGTGLNALQVITYVILIIPSEVGTIIIPTDDTKAHSVSSWPRVSQPVSGRQARRSRRTGSRGRAPKHGDLLPQS